VSAESARLRGCGNGLFRKARAAGWDAKLLAEAVKTYKAALALDPEDVVALNNLAAAYSYRAAFPLAAAALKKALALRPGDPGLRRNAYYTRLNMGGAAAVSGRRWAALNARRGGGLRGLLEVYVDLQGF
jgi:tetratricopeptide (TPR) repeat protein